MPTIGYNDQEGQESKCFDTESRAAESENRESWLALREASGAD